MILASCLAFTPFTAQILAQAKANEPLILPLKPIILSLAYSPDGNHLACVSGERDRAVGLWNPQTGKLERTFDHYGPIHSVAFS